MFIYKIAFYFSNKIKYFEFLLFILCFIKYFLLNSLLFFSQELSWTWKSFLYQKSTINKDILFYDYSNIHLHMIWYNNFYLKQSWNFFRPAAVKLHMENNSLSTLHTKRPHITSKINIWIELTFKSTSN